jgi:hypothetical protein
MPNVQEFLKDLAVKGKIDQSNPDFATVIGASGLKEVELPQVFIDQFNKGFLTKDAALNDKDIYDTHEKTARGKLFGIMDNKVNQFLAAFGDYLTDEQKAEIKNTPDTPTKLDLINKYGPVAIQEKLKTTTTAGKPSEEDKRKLEEEFNAKVKATREEVEKEWTEKLKAKEQEHQAEQVSNFIAQKIFSYNLLDNIPGGKDFLADATIHSLAKEYTLIYEKGVGVHLRRKDDPEKEVFVNNTKMTVDTVLNEKLKDYVKKSDTASNGATSTPNRSPFSAPEKPASKMTLQEMNRQKAKEEAVKLANLQKAG